MENEERKKKEKRRNQVDVEVDVSTLHDQSQNIIFYLQLFIVVFNPLTPCRTKRSRKKRKKNDTGAPSGRI